MADRSMPSTEAYSNDARAQSSAREMVDVTDEHGRVVGAVPRHEMRAKRLPHRCTFVVQLLADVTPDLETTWSESKANADEVEAWFDNVAWAERPHLYDGPGPPLAQLLTITPDTPVVVHKRADWKDVSPAYWDLAFGGVVGAGERWLPSAEREFAEEAGLSGAPVVPVGAGRFQDRHGLEFAGLFVAPTSREPMPNDGEVVAVDQVPVGNLTQWCRGRDVCRDSVALVLPILEDLIT